VKRTILAGCALVLVSACGASGGGTPATRPAGAPAVAPGGQVGVPAQGQPAAPPAATPAQAPPARQVSPQPIRPLPTPPPDGSGPAERDGVPHCPIGNPPVHRICPVGPV
jgi:hypothetical protein